MRQQSSSDEQQYSVNELTEAVTRLRLIEQSLRQELDNIARVTTSITTETRHQPAPLLHRPSRRNGRREQPSVIITDDQPTLLGNTEFAIGDRVAIRNPRRDQPRDGTAIGLTRAGYIQVKTADQQIILRYPKNLRRIN